MNIAILGFAGQGISSFNFYNDPENNITICDKDQSLDLPDGLQAQLGENYLSNLDKFDLIVRTPIIHPKDIVAANPESPDILEKVTTNTNDFFKECPTKNIIGVTGTKGKGTTSTLISKILEEAGHKVHLGGNIGTPPLDLLKNTIQKDDWVVLELANFQLIDLRHSPHIAVCLMVVPEHLDWHEDMEEYIAAKQQLFMNQTEKDIAIYYTDNENSESIASASEGELIPYFEKPGAIVEGGKITIEGNEICNVSDIALLGKHNWQNVCAAVTAVWQVAQDVEKIKSAIKNFHGLPFRIEFREEINGIRYYNDSFATAAGATIAAINAIEGRKVLIIGGYERGLKLDKLSQEIKAKSDEIRKVLLIGDSAKRTSESLLSVDFDNFEITNSKDMDRIVVEATALAEPGDSIILSPAFASFDMFKNFEERGIKFNEAISRL